MMRKSAVAMAMLGAMVGAVSVDLAVDVEDVTGTAKDAYVDVLTYHREVWEAVEFLKKRVNYLEGIAPIEDFFEVRKDVGLVEAEEILETFSIGAGETLELACTF